MCDTDRAETELHAILLPLHASRAAQSFNPIGPSGRIGFSRLKRFLRMDAHFNDPNMIDLLQRLAGADAVLVIVEATRGSAPRDPGTWMGVFVDDVVGTIGGGHLEFDAIGHARRLLSGQEDATVQEVALGPSLGQCCGGVVRLRFERITRADAQALQQRLAPARVPLALFGGGHVGRALVNALAPLPFAITWIDSRDEIFPSALPANVRCEHSDPVQGEVAALAPLSRVLIMSFSHAEDLDIVAACLRRQREHGDLAYIGLIGSATKWATFRHRLEQRGFSEAELAQVTCPIGIAGVTGKEPEVIAVSVAAQLLQLAGQNGRNLDTFTDAAAEPGETGDSHS
jgi:xanthine dehydrogenase accessory factor